jgi:hypothetical protein
VKRRDRDQAQVEVDVSDGSGVVESDRDRRSGRRDQVQAGDQIETRYINECDNKRKRK